MREYWLFDPSGFKLAAPLAGYRLRAGRYLPIDPDAAGRHRSKVLKLDLHVRAGELRLRDPATGEDLRTLDESEAMRRRGEEPGRCRGARVGPPPAAPRRFVASALHDPKSGV